MIGESLTPSGINDYALDRVRIAKTLSRRRNALGSHELWSFERRTPNVERRTPNGELPSDFDVRSSKLDVRSSAANPPVFRAQVGETLCE